MKRCIFFCFLASFFVDAAKRNLDHRIYLEEPSAKIQRLNNEVAVIVQESSLFIITDLIPLFLHFSDHRLAHSLSQVNRACFKAVCNVCFEAAKTMPPLARISKSLDLAEQAEKIILNFAFQHFVATKDPTPRRREKFRCLVRILAGLDNKTICLAVTEMLKGMGPGWNDRNEIFQSLTFVQRYREAKGAPTPHLTIYPKIVIGGYESFSEQINSEILRIHEYRDFPYMPSFDKNTEIYGKFFEDMFPIFPDFFTQKYLELDEIEALCPLAEDDVNYMDIFRDILGPFVSVVAPTPTEPLWIRLSANNFDYLWKLILNKLTFLPQTDLIHIEPGYDLGNPKLMAETGRLLTLVHALETSDALSLEGLNDMKIFRMMDYITHSLQGDPTPEYIRSIAAKVVNAEDIAIPFYLKPILSLAGCAQSIYIQMEERISALPFEECAFEPLKYIWPATILDYIRYHNLNKLPQSLGPRIRSNLHRIVRGDKEMAGKYEAIFGFMVKTFQSTSLTTALLVVSAALADPVISDEKTLFFLFDEIPVMTAFLRKCYDSLKLSRNAQRIDI